jgi:proton glutamate symport protein
MELATRPRSDAGQTRWILVGLAVGCAIGWLAPESGVDLKWVAQIFLRMIKMLIAPLLFATLASGIAGAGAKMVGRLALKSIIWFEVATTVALLIGLAAAQIAEPGAGVTLKGDAAKAAALHSPSAVEFITGIVPTSLFDALSRNDVLQVVVFSILFGLAMAAAGDKAAPLRSTIESGAEVMFKLVGIVMRCAPFGVGAAIAATLGENGTAAIMPLLTCIAALYVALLVFLGLLMLALRGLTGIHLPTFVRAIREPALIAFTTATSEAAMPRAMQILEELGVPRRIVGFVVPSGYAFNLDGSTLYLSLTLMFVVQAAGIDMSLTEQITAMLLLMLMSKGVAGVPRSALVVLAGGLTSLKLPTEGVALLLGIDAVMDMGRTCVNVVGNCVATVVVAKWERALPPDAPILGPSRIGT